MSCSSRPATSPRRSGSVPTGPRETHRLTVPADRAGERLDRYLPDAIPGISRARGQRLIEEGNVRLAGEIVRPSTRLKGGEPMTVVVPPPVPLDMVAEDLPLHVLYEDAHLLVVDKPAGMVVHPAPGHSRRNPRERAPWALRHLVRDRGRFPPGDRPPARSGHLRGSRRREDRRRPRDAVGPVRRPCDGPEVPWDRLRRAACRQGDRVDADREAPRPPEKDVGAAGGRTGGRHLLPSARNVRPLLPSRVPAGDGTHPPGAGALRAPWLSDRRGRRIRKVAEDPSREGDVRSGR